MVQAKSHPKLIRKVLNDALGRKSKSTDVKQLIDESSNSEIISSNKNIAQKFKNYFAIISNSYGENFSDRSAFEDYMCSANVGEPFKFLTVSLESLGTIVVSLKNSSPGHDEIFISIQKEFIHLLSPVMVQICNKSVKQGIFPDIKKKPLNSLFSRRQRPGKSIEKIVVAQLEIYLNQSNILTPHQFGFRHAISTENAVQGLLNPSLPCF